MRTMSVAMGVLAAAAAMAVPTESQAGVHVGIVVGAPRYGPGYVVGYAPDRYGYDRGYREGLDYGNVAVGRGLEFDERCDRDVYVGYSGWMGARYEYGGGFRRGYEAGYRRSFESARRERFDRRGDGRRAYERHGYERHDRADRDRDGYRR